MERPTGKRCRSSSPASFDFDFQSESSSKRSKAAEEIEQMLAPPPSSPGEPVMETAHHTHAEPKVVRDETFYMRDGSCILRVGNTLFNVHRTLLAKDSSLFCSMFELPQGDNKSEGSSDDCPILLQGDTVQEFRNFLWVLYALPHELSEVTAPQITTRHLDRLIDIARISFKYHFKSLETWALDVVNDHVTRKSSPVFAFPSSNLGINANAGSVLASPSAIASNGALVSRLMRLAQLCGHDRLLGTMITVLQHLMSFSIQYAHLAMTLADELDLRALRGIAYFEVMQKGDVVTRGQAMQADPSLDERTVIDADGRLIISHGQKMRLLAGYHRLTMVWERLRATPLSFEHAAACGATWHQHGCTQCWLDFWKEKTKGDSVLTLGLADVTGRLRAIGKEFAKWGSATYMHNDCRLTARKAIQDKMKQIEDALPDYFDDGL